MPKEIHWAIMMDLMTEILKGIHSATTMDSMREIRKDSPKVIRWGSTTGFPMVIRWGIMMDSPMPTGSSWGSPMVTRLVIPMVTNWVTPRVIMMDSRLGTQTDSPKPMEIKKAIPKEIH